MYKLTDSESIIRLADNAMIPKDPKNRDYVLYFDWLAAGGIPEPAFTDAEITEINRQQEAQDALTAFTAAVSLLTENAPPAETDSWSKQETEARDLTMPTPLIDGLIVSRGLGETREILAGKIIANADAYAISYSKALGEYQSKMKSLV